MLRSFFIALSRAQWAQRLITGWGFAWRMASRFIAGIEPEEAIEAVKRLNARGILVTLDHLGENTASADEAKNATREILTILDAIHASGVQSNVSIKLSQIGLSLDEDLCRANLLLIIRRANEYDNFIRIDMEDSSLTEKTLELLFWVRSQGFKNVGTVIQSYLYRSEKDVERLVGEGVRVRLVKGAYQEPAEVAYPKKFDVDRNYDRLTDLLLKGTLTLGPAAAGRDGRVPPLLALASHDVLRIAHSLAEAEKLGLPKSAVEVQMLYGIRRDLQEKLVTQGVPVRVYVPYGSHWYPYFMRRLAERPANIWFFVSNFFRK